MEFIYFLFFKYSVFVPFYGIPVTEFVSLITTLWFVGGWLRLGRGNETCQATNGFVWRGVGPLLFELLLIRIPGFTRKL